MKRPGFFPEFNRSQRRGIIIIFMLIILLQLAIYQSDNLFQKDQMTSKIPPDLQKQYDSLKIIALKKQEQKIYPFNPNYLTDEKGYFLGLNLDQLDRIYAYRKSGKYFQTKHAFKQVAGLSDSLYKILEPYINIPAYKNFTPPQYTYKKISNYDINKASAEDLRNINGIGAVLSARIIKYRNAIGGFTRKEQLNKVYGLTPEVINKIWQTFKLKPQIATPKKINVKPVNTATAEDFKKIYGIGDRLAERIVKYRKKIGGFTIPEQLNEVYGLKPEVITAFWQEFKIENPAPIRFKVDLNEANIKELAENPYISYPLAKKIVSYRTLHGAFRNFDELLNVPEYPKSKHKSICLYLKKI